MTLVDIDRAGTKKLKSRLESKVAKLRQDARDELLPAESDRLLTEVEQATFYSSWVFSAATILSALPSCKTIEDLSSSLGESMKTTNRIVHFLIQHGLILKKKDGFDFGPAAANLFVKRTSDNINSHHRNWRLRAIQVMENRDDEDLFFTSPYALSVEAAEQIQVKISKLLEEVLSIAAPSKSEKVMCLNLDWFDFRKKK